VKKISHTLELSVYNGYREDLLSTQVDLSGCSPEHTVGVSRLLAGWGREHPNPCAPLRFKGNSSSCVILTGLRVVYHGRLQ